MTDPAAFRATFSDWKLIKGRKVVQIVMEVPIEAADHAYTVLGGMPNPAESVWCAIARLKTGKGGDAIAGSITVPDPEQPVVAPPVQPQPVGRAKRSWNELSGAEQAGIRCADPTFQKFLRERYPKIWDAFSKDYDPPSWVVRNICNVSTRADIKPDNPIAFAAWNDLERDYRVWQHEPECVG